jgi:hypothetical protein
MARLRAITGNQWRIVRIAGKRFFLALRRDGAVWIARRANRKGPHNMLTVVEQHAIDRFAKNLLALSNDALIDTYHQTGDDHRAARAEGSDNLSKAHAQTLAAESAMRDRFPDFRARYKVRYP